MPPLQSPQEEAVNAALRSGSYPALRSVTCHISEQRIVLSGRVPSFYLKQVAQCLLLDRFQPLTLVNRLEVSRPAQVTTHQ